MLMEQISVRMVAKFLFSLGGQLEELSPLLTSPAAMTSRGTSQTAKSGGGRGRGKAPARSMEPSRSIAPYTNKAAAIS